MNPYIVVSFLSYFAILISIGLFFYQSNKGATDYVVGGRSLNYWVTALAAQSSDMSSWLFMAFPGAVYTHGLPACWLAFGLVIFMYLNWQYIAPKLRVATEETGSLTLSTFFEKKSGDTSGIIRLLSATICLLFFTFYISSGLVGLGRLFETAFSVDYHLGIIIGLSVAVLYTIFGGFTAVAWSDLFQGLFLLAMIVLVPLKGFMAIGGTAAISHAATAHNIPLSLLPNLTWHSILNAVLVMCGWGLGYFGQPHILINFMGIDNPQTMHKAKRVGICWQIMCLTAATAVGLVSIAFFSNGIANSELVFVAMTKQLFHPLLVGFILCGILAATISTINTQILVCASVLSEDFYAKWIRPHASQREMLSVSRIGTLIIPLIALCIAYNNNASVHDLVNYAWSGLGSAFGPLVIVSLYAQRLKPSAAIASMITGASVSALWPYFTTAVLPLVPGFGAAMIMLLVLNRTS